ncbi:SDR family NAD(P)-dependent oxidoreductase [Agromyces aerolatus]|uniref:SDR family NAD(P)-dependent oxidoreductase n=1 Tax=Agromyces sp. LY-1074 TaxID=3074080 RepID=UPI00285590EF|nr:MULTISPECIES: SDR family NAD(P)-dependent oxidoreductase [unclassified Agromyces]MDR5701678.1 SDR family NAD(P)-dependent oxidoreductase [Agromyces sp. LY-1074]MDR5707975.1 SDR family NAD(P)-dependent oxidoreductase [Agromyces sp. LY-1358]
MNWYPAPLPDQTGRRFLVTGANAGLGFFTSARLVGAGAQVVMTGRSPERLQAAADVINARVAQGVSAGETGGAASTLVIDQSSLASVAEGAAAAATLAGGAPFDGLVLNAGMVHTPARRELSVDGNELVLATNVLGHFALLARLLGHVAPVGRVVSLGSLSTQLSTFRVDDLQLERGYDLWRAYAQSKIAAQSLAFELDRRLRAAGSGVLSVVAHPGYSISGRTPLVPGVNEPSRGSRFADQLQGLWAQGKHRGAEPVLHALTAPGVEGGQFWGPRFRTKGEPVLANATRVSRDAGIGARVWAFAEQATGVPFDVAAVAPR